MKLTKKEVIKMYVDNLKNYDPPATKQDKKDAVMMAIASWKENEGEDET